MQKIEALQDNQTYIIIFFSMKTKHLFIKSVQEIMNDPELISQFNPVDAATIGMYAAKAFYTKVI